MGFYLITLNQNKDMKKKPKMPVGKRALRRKVLLSMKLIFLFHLRCEIYLIKYLFKKLRHVLEQSNFSISCPLINLIQNPIYHSFIAQRNLLKQSINHLCL